jgi:hypothetical protein
MKRKSVISATFTSLGYDRESLVLEAEFRDGGVYQYFDVPPDLGLRFLIAPSKGRFFARHIRDRFRFRRVS